MPLDFNRYPLGLLGLLDAKVRGRTPNELGDVTLPTLDITDFLLAQGVEVLNDDTAAIAVVGRHFGAAARLTVPNDEIWYCHAGSARPTGVLLAATTYTHVCIHETTLAVGTSPIGNFAVGDTVTGTVGQRAMAGNQNKPWIMAPGDRFGLFASTVTLGTAAAFELFLRFTRLRV